MSDKKFLSLKYQYSLKPTIMGNLLYLMTINYAYSMGH